VYCGSCQPPLTLPSGDVAVGLRPDEIRADEFCAMLIIAEERDLLEREKLPAWRNVALN
jgi:hypothetical protein